MFTNFVESFLFRLSQIVAPFNKKFAERLRDKSEERVWNEFRALQKAEEEKRAVEDEVAWAAYEQQQEEEYQEYLKQLRNEMCPCGHNHEQHGNDYGDVCCTAKDCVCPKFGTDKETLLVLQKEAEERKQRERERWDEEDRRGEEERNPHCCRCLHTWDEHKQPRGERCRVKGCTCDHFVDEEEADEIELREWEKCHGPAHGKEIVIHYRDPILGLTEFYCMESELECMGLKLDDDGVVRKLEEE